MSKDGVSVRAARAEDCGALHAMLVALAVYEREPDAVKATPETLRRDGFGPRPHFEAIIAERNGRPVGFALWTSNYSTWEGRAGFFLEDIFVCEEARKYGVGVALMARLARIARDRGLGRIDLNVLTWNPARGFYERLGIAHIDDWAPYRLRGEALDRLAARDEA
ncbi:MAG: N-acetyltransferase family protein [Reyranellaceae bacterium]